MSHMSGAVFLVVSALSFWLTGAGAQDLPTVYEYYTAGGVKSGLEANKDGFKLNGKDIVIQSGAIHYFRVHPKYWRDRLKKLRATGLIAVETYVPWNLHEPEKDVFDFGDGGRDFSEFLDLPTFIKTAQEEDLLVLLRPGPYICAEWEMGGLPSWLLNIPSIGMRTSERQYSERVANYFNHLLPLIRNLQFTNNGSIIAVQLENEYSSVGISGGPDQQHVRNLKDLMDKNGVKELLYTSDNSPADAGSIPEVLRTINFQSNVNGNLQKLVSIQPDKPPMVMEYWTGWFDHWMEKTERLNFSPEAYRQNLEDIMKFPASFNLYMFHGGTSFGFMNGANADSGKESTVFDVTSYDYFAPLSEAGDYTLKYQITQTLVDTYQPVKLKRPPQPEPTLKLSYSAAAVEDFLDLPTIFQAAGTPILSTNVANMESLNINGGSGQSYGYIWYHKSGLDIKSGQYLKIFGHVRDVAQVFVDGKLQSKVLESHDDLDGFGYWKNKDQQLKLTDSGTTLDILVENLGRINYGIDIYDDKKGLFEGPVLINSLFLENWEIVPLEFKKNWILSLDQQKWKKYNYAAGTVAPGLYRTTLNLPTDREPGDTYVDLSGWTKGVVFVNGFNLGRYNKLGPQKRLFLPAPLLQRGENKIIIFEQFVPASNISFPGEPDLGS